MTATERGSKSRAIEAAAAFSERPADLSTKSGVGVRITSIRSPSAVARRRMGKPQLAKTSSMRGFGPSMRASNAPMPRARAISASRSSSRVPTPWPRSASSTENVTSARAGSDASRR